MFGDIVALVQAQVQAAVRRAVVPTVFAIVAGLFLIFTLAALFVALFFWLAPAHGRTVAVLIVAAVAFVLALLSLLPLAFASRGRPPGPRQSQSAAPQLLSLMARSASGVPPRQLAAAAALIAAAFILARRRPRK
jgi:hypothetical protein